MWPEGEDFRNACCGPMSNEWPHVFRTGRGDGRNEVNQPYPNMNKAFSFALIVVGAVLLIYGINASESIGSDISRLFTGSPTDEAVWLTLGGIVALALGIGGLAMRSKSR